MHENQAPKHTKCETEVGLRSPGKLRVSSRSYDSFLLFTPAESSPASQGFISGGCRNPLSGQPLPPLLVLADSLEGSIPIPAMSPSGLALTGRII